MCRSVVFVIAGPTASGKSALALDIARAFDGTVINADSMQVYRDLAVLTARPGQGDCRSAPHLLYGVLGAEERCSAARWRALAMEAIDATLGQGRLPVVAGGTGLYLKALIEGLSPMPDIPEAVRAGVRARLAAEGAVALHAELALADAESAARIPPTDSQRIARALEVVEATGTPLSRWQTAAPEGPPEGLVFRVIVLLPPRDALYATCDRRFGHMLKQGAIEEVSALLARGLDPGLPAMKALGVADIARYLRGDRTLEEAAAQARTLTRRYAKRQLTWLRHQIVADLVLEAQYSESLRPRVFAFVRENLLTG